MTSEPKRTPVVQAELVAILNARDQDGNFRYTAEQIADASAFFLLCSGIGDPTSLDDTSRHLVLDFAGRAGLVPNSSGEQMSRAIWAYLGAHPVPDELLVLLEQHYRGRLAAGTPGGRAAQQRLADLIGTKMASAIAGLKVPDKRGAVGIRAAPGRQPPPTRKKKKRPDPK